MSIVSSNVRDPQLPNSANTTRVFICIEHAISLPDRLLTPVPKFLDQVIRQCSSILISPEDLEVTVHSRHQSQSLTRVTHRDGPRLLEDGKELLQFELMAFLPVLELVGHIHFLNVFEHTQFLLSINCPCSSTEPQLWQSLPNCVFLRGLTLGQCGRVDWSTAETHVYGTIGVDIRSTRQIRRRCRRLSSVREVQVTEKVSNTAIVAAGVFEARLWHSDVFDEVLRVHRIVHLADRHESTLFSSEQEDRIFLCHYVDPELWVSPKSDAVKNLREGFTIQNHAHIVQVEARIHGLCSP
ncbi:unnamed protein product [Periconia digitata]|uniref:Uncharacterized protein n=1 Tax=Periconia digitata TaxID=1303443 RepID=A0A9W4UDS5_9PLEO|nr:unnamed protein product [Periconia digitata]